MKKKLLIFIITYKAQFRIKRVFEQIPFSKLKNFKVEILISDDASKDTTIKFIRNISYKKKVIKKFNKINLGYGGNIKTCLNYGKKKNFDFALMLHGDGQYHPKYLPMMMKKFKNPNTYAVTGSRMMNKNNALKGKMPLYKFIGNIILTKLTNFITDRNFTDCHSGFWAYRMDMFNKINLNKITKSFNFDQQIRLSCVKYDLNIEEVPIRTIYGTERSSIHLVYATRYLIELIKFIFK